MKPISLSVSESEYEAFRVAARAQGRPIAEMIREAMAFYRAEKISARQDLTTVPVLVGHRPVAPLPARSDLYDDMVGRPA